MNVMRMKNKMKYACTIFCAIFVCTAFTGSQALASITAQYLYNLTGFTGTSSFSGGKITIDHENNETYVIYGNEVSVFNANGMEIYSFSYLDTDLGIVQALAVLPEGDMITLETNVEKGSTEIIRRNYRGEPIAEIKIKELPAGFSFSPSRMVYRGGLLYFADTDALQVVTTDLSGLFQQRYDLFSALELEPKDLGDKLLTGFDISKSGDILFTVSVLFRAFVLSPAGKLREFGEGGSLPGKFNIVGGITTDNKGNYLVTDRLKGAAQIFDSGFNFQYMFGDWGGRPGTLRVPNDIVVDHTDKVFIAQGAAKGVSVYRLLYE